MTTTALIKPKDFKGELTAPQMKERILSALPVTFKVNVDRLIATAAVYYAEDKKLWECSRVSLMSSILECAALGFDLNKTKGQCALVAFGKTCTFMPMWKGLRDLAMRSGKITKMYSRIVHKNDDFKLIYGLNEDLIHIPETKKAKGQVVGAYAVAHFSNGEKQFEFMDFEELEKIRKHSNQRSGAIWSTWTEEMYKKTVIKRLCKSLPATEETEELLDAIRMDNETFYKEQETPTLDEGEQTKPPQRKTKPETESETPPEDSKSEQKPPPLEEEPQPDNVLEADYEDIIPDEKPETDTYTPPEESAKTEEEGKKTSIEDMF